MQTRAATALCVSCLCASYDRVVVVWRRSEPPPASEKTGRRGLATCFGWRPLLVALVAFASRWSNSWEGARGRVGGFAPRRPVATSFFRSLLRATVPVIDEGRRPSRDRAKPSIIHLSVLPSFSLVACQPRFGLLPEPSDP